MSWLFRRRWWRNTRRPQPGLAAPCAQLSVMPAAQFWRNDKTRGASDLSRFGLTCAKRFDGRPWRGLVDVVSGASRLPGHQRCRPGAGIEGARSECGATWRGSLARFDPGSCTWKTAQPSLLVDSDECSVTYRSSGMTADGQLPGLPTLAPHQRDRFWLVGADTLRDRREADHGREPARDGDGHGAAHAAGRKSSNRGLAAVRPCGRRRPCAGTTTTRVQTRPAATGWRQQC